MARPLRSWASMTGAGHKARGETNRVCFHQPRPVPKGRRLKSDNSRDAISMFGTEQIRPQTSFRLHARLVAAQPRDGPSACPQPLSVGADRGLSDEETGL